jgi:hypothetical protein
MSAKSERARRLRINRTANAVMADMRGGQQLHLEYRQTGPRWSLSNGRSVLADAARIVIANPEIMAEADSLFPGISAAQTFIYRKGVS